MPDFPERKNIPFTTVIKSAYGGPSHSLRTVITTEEGYKDFFDQKPPSIPEVDFSKEQVLVVAMGHQKTSGYSTEVISIVRETGGFAKDLTFVSYCEKSPDPDETVLDVNTSPMHVVKCEKLSPADKHLFEKISRSG